MAVIESALGAVSKIGPYFSAVSLIPAGGLTFSIYILARSHPWRGTPDWRNVVAIADSLSLPGVVVGAIITVAIAMVLHPLQFSVVQFLEGYWGTHPIALRAANARIRFHYGRFNDLSRASQNSLRHLPSQENRDNPPSLEELPWRWRVQEARRALSNFPEEEHDVMPTRLGNVLRRYESRAGRPYGISVVLLASHLGLVAPKEQLDYLQDQRTQLDLAIRLALTSAVLAIATTVLFAPSGLWVLLALAPYVGAYLFYRGSCVVAHHYGDALETLMDLNRHRVYDSLNLKPVWSLADERRQNQLLNEVLRRSTTANMPIDARRPPASS